jgi:hypothetical protein
MIASLQIYALSTLLVFSEAFTTPLRGNYNARLLSVTTLLPVKQNPSWGISNAPHHVNCILPPLTQTKTTAIFAASLSEGDGSSLSSSSSPPLSTYNENNYNNEEEDEEWEFEEYERLSESDFYGSEWKVGTLMEGSKTIDETWCRCAVQDGQFIAVWGDGSDGRWNFDAGSQFFSITKESFGGWFGKKIWAGTVDDYYFMEGTVRGWSPIQPASVIGQWQMKRLGVDPEEAGVAPWFSRDDEGMSEEEGTEQDDNNSQESS